MDKLPRLRRKPKPPAIETSMDRTSGGMGKEGTATTTTTTTTTTTELASPKPSSMRRSPLRNLKFRVAAKRARAQSPAPNMASSPTVAVFSQSVPRPVMPAFLNMSLADIESKFHELTWAERNRLARSDRSDLPKSERWTIHRHPDGSQRSIMDRYANIQPWDHNRVKLDVAQDEYDYVNASTITLDPLARNTNLPPLRYIAMQGPTLPSLPHVWRMVAEQTRSPAVIVQLTSMMEGGVVKCHRYFPDNDDEPDTTANNDPWILNGENLWNDGWKARLTLASCEELADGAIQKRELLLHVRGEPRPRTIWHFLYTRWPDFGVPTLHDLDSFFDLMDLSREHADPSHPRIIHCSAGVGRTGTFICLEHLMRELDAGTLQDTDSDIIFDTVDLLRQQRRSMVQSEAQFRFLYHVMRNLWQTRHGLALDAAHVADGREPAPKRLEVADGYSSEEASSPSS